MIEFKNQTEISADLFIYGDIGESFWNADTVTAKKFAKSLHELGDIASLNIYINSGGGNVFEAVAIHSMLKRHAANKTVYIDGIAASAASVIAMVGDTIIMPSNSIMMIHRAWGCTSGNTHDFEKFAQVLEQIDKQIAETYAGKTALDTDEVLQLMDAETWFSAEDAVSMGFADKIEHEKQIAASIEGNYLVIGGVKADLTAYKNFNTETYRAEIELPEPVAIKDPDPDPDVTVTAEQSADFRRIRNKILTTFKEEK